MYIHSSDTELQRKIQSIEFERSVDQAVQAFMYDLDFMLLEEQHTRNRHQFVRPSVPKELLVPAA